MLSVKSVVQSVSVLALAGITACATTSSPQLAEEEGLTPVQKAMQDALQIASPEEIAIAERSDPLTRASFWGDQYSRLPNNEMVITKFMNSLRGIRQFDRAIEVGSSALPVFPRNSKILLETGRSLRDAGRLEQAAQVLARSADYSEPTDATSLAALGVVFDRLEQHERAQQAYRYALAREPNRLSTLSNYGLSLAMSGRLSEAETSLRKAVEHPQANGRVRQNLALVLGLQGRFSEIPEVDPNAPKHRLDANLETLKRAITGQSEMSGVISNAKPLTDEDPFQLSQAEAREIEPMPAVREVAVADEALPEPVRVAASPTRELTSSASLEGGDGITAAPVRLKLRGSTSK